MNKTPAFKMPLQTEPRFHLRRYEQPHTIGGPRSNRRPTNGSPSPAPAAATTTPAPGGRTAATMASGRTPLPASLHALKLTTPAVDQPRVVEVRPSHRASERPLPRTLKERLTHEPAREVELRLSPASAPARMMNILEAEGGTKIAARLASPHPGAGGHRLG
jgi:hypothetical protein